MDRMLLTNLALTIACFCSALHQTSGYLTGGATDEECINLRANENAGNVISYHNVEQNANLTKALTFNITRLENEPPVGGKINHHKYRIQVIVNPALNASLAGWMIQVRDNGSQGGNAGALNAGNIRGMAFNQTNPLTTNLYDCPTRLGQDKPEVPNGMTHVDSAYNNAPNTPAISEVEFYWAPVNRNGTDENGNINYISSIPKCGKVVATVMLKDTLLWWHALESSCFISYSVEDAPLDCNDDLDCL